MHQKESDIQLVRITTVAIEIDRSQRETQKSREISSEFREIRKKKNQWNKTIFQEMRKTTSSYNGFLL